MATMSASIAGWACRAQKVWFPSSGLASVSSMPSGVNAVASCPTKNASSSSSSGNKFTTMIGVTMPGDSTIGSIVTVKSSPGLKGAL